MTTKKELEQELHTLRQEKNEALGRYYKALDRQKLAGLYLQALRLLPAYTDNKEGTFLTCNDYDRLLSVLEMDKYPEGF